MAAITRTGTDQHGNSDPGRDVRPKNDYVPLKVTMKVAVEAGQHVQIDTDGFGILGSATVSHGVASMPAIAGRATALIRQGKTTGFSGMTPGHAVYIAASGVIADAGSIVVGFATSATDIYFEYPALGN